MIELNLQRIQSEIEKVAKHKVKLIGASKTVPPHRIREAYDAGLHRFGENKIQEGIKKIEELPKDIEWHFIGHLQSNKVRQAVSSFSCIQSVDSNRLLSLIDSEAKKQQKLIPVLIEINLAGEDSKHGLAPEKLKEILDASDAYENVQVQGLMAIPPFLEDPERVRPYFRRLREMAQPYPQLKELSMGMSHDYIAAIEEGATIVRIGTALFGERIKP
jgi:pyridoxal phosphate enzyme (YggS family)